MTTFADHEVVHGGKTSLRMENIGKNQYRHCRHLAAAQAAAAPPVPHLLLGQDREPVARRSRGQGAHRRLADARSASRPSTPSRRRTGSTTTWSSTAWTTATAMLYLGSWYGKDGKMWWDDLQRRGDRPGQRAAPARLPGHRARRERHGLRGGARLTRRSWIRSCIPWRAYHEPPRDQADCRTRASRKASGCGSATTTRSSSTRTG